MKYLVKLLGVTLIAIGGYYVYKTGYHLIYYELTTGLEAGTFGYPRPYWEITLEFIFWLTIIAGGIGFYSHNKTGIKFGIYSLIIPIFLSTLSLLVVVSKKLDYSTTMMVNAEKREMSVLEQWEYIYLEPIKLAFLLFLLVFIVWKMNKYLKTV